MFLPCATSSQLTLEAAGDLVEESAPIAFANKQFHQNLFLL